MHPYTRRLPHPRQTQNFDRRTGGQEVLKGVVFKVMAYMCVGLHPGAASRCEMRKRIAESGEKFQAAAREYRGLFGVFFKLLA